VNVFGTTTVLGVFGHPVSHSLSPLLHNAAIRALKIDYIYVPFHVLPCDLPGAISGVRALQIAGVNLTIPHKERVIELLDEVGEHAARIQSVNTVINRDGWLCGESTDGPGFMRSAEAEWGSLRGARVLLLGAGGAAKAVAYALAESGCEVTVANRTPERAEALVNGLNTVLGRQAVRSVAMTSENLSAEIGNADLLVNTTSVGMSPELESIPIDPELLHKGLLVYDLVYSPPRTRLMAEAEARGAKAVNGIGMLVHQGAISFQMWTGLEPPIMVMQEAALAAIQ